MQIRIFISKYIIISLLTCFFLLFQPPIKNCNIQSITWAGDQGWSDAFGNSQGKKSPSVTQSGGSESGWNTVIDNQNSSPHSFEQPLPKKEKSVQTDPKQISAEEGKAIKIAKPAPGVAELPIKILFSGKLGENWETFGVAGGNFEKFGCFENGKMIVSVPAKHYWGKTGILSKKPLLILDRYTTDKAPYRIQIKVDPEQTKGFRIAFDGSKNADMWSSHRLWIGVGGSTFLYHTHSTGSESREKPTDWNGIVNIVIGNGWFSVQLSDGKTIRSQINIKPGHRFFITIFSSPDSEHGACSLALESITLQKIAPEGMTALQRWELVDDDEFDVDGFWKSLALELLKEEL